MHKVQMAEKIARLLAPKDQQERTRIYRHHMNRTTQQVRETYLRTLAIESVTPAECALHCQPARLV